MSNSNPPGSPVPAAPSVLPAPAAQNTPVSGKTKVWMFVVSVAALFAVAFLGVKLVNSIPMVSELPKGVESPLEYILQEAAVKFAVPVAFLGVFGAIISLVALVAGKSKLWLEFLVKLSALCAIIYTSTLIFVASW